MTSKGDAIKAATSVAADIASGKLKPEDLVAAALAECEAIVGQVVGPGDPAWELQLKIARGVLAVDGVPYSELAEWAAVHRDRPKAAADT